MCRLTENRTETGIFEANRTRIIDNRLKPKTDMSKPKTDGFRKVLKKDKIIPTFVFFPKYLKTRPSSFTR